MELYKIAIAPGAEKDKENIVRYLREFSANIARIERILYSAQEYDVIL